MCCRTHRLLYCRCAHVATIAIGFLASGPLAYADTLHVPNEYPTIQAAIDAAEPGNTVLVADGVYTGLGNKNLDLCGKAITVESENGPDNCIIDCESDGRGFYFHSNESASAVVGGFTITNGRMVYGGGIRCRDASSPTIIDCTITSNAANRMGGGIHCASGSSPEIVACRIIANVAGAGGGISCLNGTPTITDCTIAENRATYDPGDGFGAGIYAAAQANVTIIGCTIANNTADQDGGGINCLSSQATISNCAITQNAADDCGGGVIAWDSENVTLTACTISGNTARRRGGGISVSDSQLAVTDCTISNNSVPDSAAGGGGGVSLAGVNGSTMRGCSISYNTAGQNGGGLLCRGATGLLIVGCDIRGNETSAKLADGAGIYCQDSGCVEIADCLIADNTVAPLGNGGGIVCSRTTFIAITDCAITTNTTLRGDGAGMYCTYNDNVVLSRCAIGGNTANGAGASGGGVYCQGDGISHHLVLAECAIADNATTGCSHGGGICGSGVSATISASEIIGNTAAGEGGGIYWKRGDIAVERCTISDNLQITSGPYCSLGGGGMHLDDIEHVAITASTIIRNTANQNGGGILCYECADAEINGCTITDNAAAYYGGGVHCCDSRALVANSILWSNAASSGAACSVGDDHYGTDVPADLTLAYNDVDGGAGAVYASAGATLRWGSGNVDADPLFVNPDCGDYHLAPNSPCIGSGDPQYFRLDEFDWDNEPRVMAGRVDMGIDEFSGRPFVFGDLNCDGERDGFDIAPFVLALQGPDPYYAVYPDCTIENADCNSDGFVDGFDIDAFMDLLLITSPPVAEDSHVLTYIDTPVTFGLSARDDGFPDPPGALIYIITALPTYELRDAGNDRVIVPDDLPYALVNGGSHLTYTPPAVGEDSIQFKVNDAGTSPYGGDSNVATVSITFGAPLARWFTSQTDFEQVAAAAGYRWLATETFEENISDDGLTWCIDDPLAYGVTNREFPTGLDAPLAVQSNRSAGFADAPNPRGVKALVGVTPGADYGATSDVVASGRAKDSYDMVFADYGGYAAVGFSAVEFEGGGQLEVGAYDTNGVYLGQTVVIADAAGTFFAGVVADPGVLMGRINIFSPADGYEGGDSIRLYGPGL
ncbi:MAG: right-handed parallel beta-helix repeat-containing protein [Planctomycetes bacterium]|nr:right-handed parallel beta-helix repeat-containing protein [Planctomycetota bacterium]